MPIPTTEDSRRKGYQETI
uniref:Uncharacterized protein n=1 Tax=Rhizophora mucronata TaxID=61149 RepID=A0A2P2PCE7_RHIMU